MGKHMLLFTSNNQNIRAWDQNKGWILEGGKVIQTQIKGVSKLCEKNFTKMKRDKIGMQLKCKCNNDKKSP